MKFRAFMVCVLSFLVVTGSACFLNREQEKEEKLKAVYAAESTVSRVKSQLNRYLAESELVKNIIESGYDIDGEKFSILSQMMQDKQNVIEAHELAKDGIVSHIYPMKGNHLAPFECYILQWSCFHYFYSITDAALIVLIMSFQLNGFLNDLTDHWVLYVVLDCYNDGLIHLVAYHFTDTGFS